MSIVSPELEKALGSLKGSRIGRILRKFSAAGQFGKFTQITPEVIEELVAFQQTPEGKGRMLGQLLKERGLIDEAGIQKALAAQKGFAFVDLEGFEPAPEAIKCVDRRMPRQFVFMPLEHDPVAKSITVAVLDPNNIYVVENLKEVGNMRRVNVVVADEAQVRAMLDRHYPSDQARTVDSSLDVDRGFADERFKGRGSSLDDDTAALSDAANDNAVVQLVQKLLMVAIEDKASDIHMEPFEDEFKVRYRIDGVLYEMIPVQKSLATALVSRVKVMSKLDIAERRLPQDGRIELAMPTGPIDLRVAVLPTMFGESVVMRILDRSNVQLSLDKVGLGPVELERVRNIINKPNGIVVVTGPTGSGKTTTLYAALNELNDPGVKILTAEDPVEYDVAGLMQCQVNLEQELTFARLLRSFLRQDPDIILVGEIRDLETAQIAIQASLTGHLVLTTLHTNDAPSTVLRLVDLGVETFLLTATIEAIVAQRLVRTVCSDCKEAFTPTEEMLMELALRPADVEGKEFYRGSRKKNGRLCERCRGSGYKGRMGIFEIMSMDDDLRELIMKQVSTNILRAEARKRGMKTLRESGLDAIFNGRTTIDEVVRETITEE
ncbi:MAG: Flp pilus assembly complex ATPase component TadA [Planctomycetaceae bacterium]|nr:Flp pilus assembly complex ATPase component TadA [Planctomycetaceae bacterium]